MCIFKRTFCTANQKNCSLLRGHPYITSAKDWVGGFRKLSVLLTIQYCKDVINGKAGEAANLPKFSDTLILPQKIQNYADVIYF